MLLFSILADCGACGDKLLVFSQSLLTLNVIEKYLSNSSAQVDGCSGQWVKGIDYFRLDGSINIATRTRYCNTFNDEMNSQARFALWNLNTKRTVYVQVQF